MTVESVTKALQDAKINIQKIDQACVGYVYGNEQRLHILLLYYHLYIRLYIFNKQLLIHKHMTNNCNMFIMIF